MLPAPNGFTEFNDEERDMKQAPNMTQHTPTIAVWTLIAFLLGGCGGGGGDSGGGAAPAPGPTPIVGAIALPKTGQTTCFDASGVAIACAGTGQDGELQTGVAEPSPRFVVDGTGNCATDNLTGLIWVRTPSSTPDTWTNALASANGLTLCGFLDWRLPNRKELRSLVNHNLANNADSLNTLGFSGVQADFYWSSSSDAGFASIAWRVRMSDGVVTPDDKSVSNYVWPVRAGQ